MNDKSSNSNWKAQSEDFRNMLKLNRKQTLAEKNPNYVMSKQDLNQMKQLGDKKYNSQKECNYCYRKFDEKAIQRHIDICRNVKSKPKAVKPMIENYRKQN